MLNNRVCYYAFVDKFFSAEAIDLTFKHKNSDGCDHELEIYY